MTARVWIRFDRALASHLQVLALLTDHWMTRPSVEMDTSVLLVSMLPAAGATQATPHTGSAWDPPAAVHRAAEGVALRRAVLNTATVPS